MSAQTIRFSLAVLLVIGELTTGIFYPLIVAIRLTADGLAVPIGLTSPA